MIFDKIALRKKTRFREVSPVLNKLVRRRLQEGQNLPSAEKKTPTDVCFSVGVFEWDVLF